VWIRISHFVSSKVSDLIVLVQLARALLRLFRHPQKQSGRLNACQTVRRFPPPSRSKSGTLVSAGFRGILHFKENSQAMEKLDVWISSRSPFPQKIKPLIFPNSVLKPLLCPPCHIPSGDGSRRIGFPPPTARRCLARVFRAVCLCFIGFFFPAFFMNMQSRGKKSSPGCASLNASLIFRVGPFFICLFAGLDFAPARTA